MNAIAGIMNTTRSFSPLQPASTRVVVSTALEVWPDRARDFPSARPAERRELPPAGLYPRDSPQVARFFANYWVAQANVPWALQKFDRAD